jgi:hypothetical protein
MGVQVQQKVSAVLVGSSCGVVRYVPVGRQAGNCIKRGEGEVVTTGRLQKSNLVQDICHGHQVYCIAKYVVFCVSQRLDFATHHPHEQKISQSFEVALVERHSVQIARMPFPSV